MICAGGPDAMTGVSSLQTPFGLTSHAQRIRVPAGSGVNGSVPWMSAVDIRVVDASVVGWSRPCTR